MSLNNRIFFNGVLRPRLLNNHFASCSFINLDILLPHTANFDNNIGLPFFVFITFEFTFSVYFLHFKQYVNMYVNLSIGKLILRTKCQFLELILFQLLFLLGFCFKNIDFSDTQSAHFDLSPIT